MTINFDALKTSLAKISKIGQGEETFEAGNSTVTVRVLSSLEEVEVEKFAQVAWDEATSDEDRAALTDYIDRMRVGTLSHVIIQIDDMDLREEEFIEMEEEFEVEKTDDQGTTTKVTELRKVKRPRYQAMRKLIIKWSRPVIHVCYLKYGQHVQNVEVQASKAIKYTPDDIDQEVERLEKRVEALQSLKETQTKQEGANIAGQARDAINQLSTDEEDRIQGLAQTMETQHENPAPEPVVAAPEPPQPPQEPASQPPPRRPRQRHVPQQQAAPPERRPEAPPQTPPTDAQGIPLPHEGDSIFDPSDGDEAMQAEAQRQLEFRRQMEEVRNSSQPQSPEEVPQEVLNAIPPRKPPPHRAAQNTANVVANANAGAVQAARGGKQPPEGVEMYRMPTQEVGPRDRSKAPPRKVLADAAPKGGVSRNPRFKGPGQ